MKQLFILILLLPFSLSVFAQKKDLIVTVEGDSLICKIDSVNTQFIFYEAKYNYKLIHTALKRENVKEYKKECIRAKDYLTKPGGSIIQKEYKSRSMFDINKNLLFLSTKLFSYGVNYERIFPIKENLALGVKVGTELNNGNNLNNNLFNVEFNLSGYGPKNNIEFGTGYQFPFNMFFKLGYKYQSPAGFVFKVSPTLTHNFSVFSRDPDIYVWGEISIGKSF